MGRRRRSTLLAAPLGALILAGCQGQGPATGPTIRFGASIDRSANNAEPSWGDVIKLAEAQMNAALKQSNIDLRFEFTIRDSANDPTTSVANSVDFVTTLGVKGLILDTSQNDSAVNRTFYDTDAANDLGVPLICGGCTSGSINNPTNADPDLISREAFHNTLRWNFRAIMSTKLLSKVIAGIVQRTNLGDVNGTTVGVPDGKIKVGFYGSNEAFGKGARADIESAFRTNLGCAAAPNPCPNFIIDDIFHAQDADPNSYPWANDVASLFSNVNTNTQLPDGYPDAVVAAHFAQQDAAFTRAYKAAGTSIRVMHFQTFRLQSALKAAQEAGEGEEGVSHLTLDTSPSGTVFRDDYQAAFSTLVVYRDSIYYDAATTLMLGALIGALPLSDPTKVTGTQVAEGMRRTSDLANGGAVVRTGVDELVAAIAHVKAGEPINYEGASGPVDFDASQNILDKLVHYQIQGGKFVDVEAFDCVSSSACPLVGQ
ncbi:MAG TPA: hypothetical protein VND93_01640 [Myxococcales bacterium]|jgi:ABC-type branched-subunit amino acid transport system substrate-binding protein|nr:hypothetical protein [Myxococcales bacterium]